MKQTSLIFSDIMFTQYDSYIIYEDGTIIPSEGSRLQNPVKMLSSNGNEYVLLRNNKNNPKFYYIDKIMVFCFNRKDMFLNTVYDFEGKPRVKVKHIDNDPTNHHIDNLKCYPDNEEWVQLVYPNNIVKDKYEISSWGRIRTADTNKFIKTGLSDDGYVTCGLYCINSSGEKSPVPNRLHRLMALTFIKNENPEELTVVDHIDGCKTNCDIDNLHWVTQAHNIRLAIACGKGSISKITTDEIDMVINLLLVMNGSIKDVYNHIDHLTYPYITNAVINDIKHHDPAYIRMDSKYDLKSIEFKKRTRKADLTDDEIEEICKAIVECKFNIGDALQYLHDKGMTHILRHDVRHIRDKSKRSDISDKYFSRDDYEHPKTPMTDTEIIEVCKALVKYNGNIAKATKEMNDNGYAEINKFQVQDIKYKKKRPDISNIFFTYENKEFKAL